MQPIKLIGIAKNSYEQERGLMHVKELKEFTGMLFDFHRPRVLSFWMKDTYIPLDIAFIDKDGIITNIDKMAPHSLRRVSSIKPCQMVLEVPVNTLEKIGAKEGKKVIVDWKTETVTIDD